MIEVQPPHKFAHLKKTKVFFGGSIEMDTAERWQARLFQTLVDYDADIVVLNPRRDDWDADIVQRGHDARFSEQVNWELDALDDADIIIFYFDPNTKSPITLMELGLYANSGRVIVCCPDGFWRKGNVEIVCQRSSVPLVNSYNELVDFLCFTLSAAKRLPKWDTQT